MQQEYVTAKQLKEVNRLNKRIANLETQLADIRASLVEFTYAPYKDSDLVSLFQWINARACKLIQDMDKTSELLSYMKAIT